MRLKLYLIRSFFLKFQLSNICVIKYAYISIKKEIIDRQPLDWHNNPVTISLNTPDEKIKIGAYEASYCLDYAKAIRREIIAKFLKQNGRLTFYVNADSVTNIHKICIAKVARECGFEVDREEHGRGIVYTLY